MAIRSVPVDPAEVLVGATVPPSKVLVVGGQTSPVLTGASFTHVQGIGGAVTGSNTITLTLPSNPIRGNLICVAVANSSAVNLAGMTVIDANGNSYSITPSSPTALVATSGSVPAAQVSLFYLTPAPSNASRTININWVGSTNAQAWADEFSPSSGVAVFDKDATASIIGSSPIFAPGIMPTYPGSLLYSIGCINANSGLTAPAAGATLGKWTGATGAITNGSMAAYALSASPLSGPTFVQYTTTATEWASAVMSFYIAATSNFLPISLGPNGRSIMVEGVPGADGVPVPTTVQGLVAANLYVGGIPASQAYPGTLAVGISGVGGTPGSNSVLDAPITVQTAPVNGLATLVVNRTSAPSMTTGQSVAAQCDYVGSQFIKPYRRSQTTSKATTIALSAAATTVLAAQAAGIFADISSLVISITPAAVTAIQFTATLSDGTNSYIYDLDTGITAATAAEGVGLNLTFNPPLPATTAATAWTIQLSVATVTVHITVVAVLQKAS
jgi:hypothetical protein